MASTRRAQPPVLGHRYRLIRQIDAGGMGSVWLAEAVHLRSLVAVKVMGRALAATPEAAQRFLHEARTAASLRSPHVVQILDYGVHDSTPFIVMELLEGESLAVRLKREGRLASWEQTELVLRHVARALARAHDAGVIHRDLKPGNIFLVRNEEEELVKLLDFGIAKTTLSPLGAPLPSDTRTGEFLGSPAYASPEQLQASKAIDHRADIWSLGVIAYECLLGQAPFAAEGFVAMLLAICTGPLPVPSERGAVPPGFDAWFARACAREVDERFQSVRDASAELRRIVDAARGSPEALAVAAAHAARERASPEPPSDGALAPESGAPEPHSLTAPLPLMLAPSPPSWPAVAPPLRTDTVRLGPPDGPRRRRRGAAVTTALVVAAVVALGVVSAGESSSRAALDWSPLGLGAPAATPADEVPGARVAASHPDDDPRGLAPASAPARVEATSVEAGRVEPASLAPAALEGGASVDPATALEPPSSATAPSSADATPPASSADPTPPAPSDPAPSDVAAAPRRAADPAPALPEPGAGAAPRAPSPEPAAAPARARAPEPVSRPPRRPGPPRASGAAGAARSDVARLTVTASAPAAVLIDGVPYGTTPLQSIPVEPGTHEVAFIQDGKRSAERLTIRSGEHKRVEAASARPPSDGLDEAAVKRTIKRNRAAVVDGCWDHAFDSSSPGAPTSVRVPVTVNVEPSGVVRSVATEAEPPGYPALRRCVEDRVAAWRFPSARADTVVTVAFVFVLR